jgi:hypothetical protein
MGYESRLIGWIEIDKDKWETFRTENSKNESVLEWPEKFDLEDMTESWDGDKLEFFAGLGKQYGFEEFLSEVVKLLNENQIGYFDEQGEYGDRSAFYLKKDKWEVLEWKEPQAPNWWLEIKNK